VRLLRVRFAEWGVVALEILVESIEASSGEEMAESFVVAVAGGEVGAVKTAKLEDGGGGASLVVESGFRCGIAGAGLGFIFAEDGVGGVGHRAGSFPRGVSLWCEERCQMRGTVCLAS
jgi:hypothetical protein